MCDANLKEITSNLKTTYELLVERRKSITGQAQNLMGFTGIIQTILIALIVGLVTNKDVQSLLESVPNYSLLTTLIGVGFVSYIMTTFFCLIPFIEPRLRIVPLLGSGSGSGNGETYEAITAHFAANPSDYQPKQIVMQYGIVIDQIIRSNQVRYTLVIFALIFLVVISLVSTLAGGFAILSVQSPIGFESMAVWLPLATGLVGGLIYEVISMKRRT